MPNYQGEDTTRAPSNTGGRAGVRAGLARPRPVAGLTRAATSQARAEPSDTRLVAAPNETSTPTATTILPSASEVKTARRQQLIDPHRLVSQALSGVGIPASGGAGKWGPKDILKIAARYKGVPYLYGGTTTKGLDCSGYTQLVFKALGIHLPRTSRSQASVGRRIGSLASARPGDLVFYANSNGTIHHVGIYAGNGMYWNAPHTGSSVRLAKVGRPFLIKRVL